jgi:hypothetical protein
MTRFSTKTAAAGLHAVPLTCGEPGLFASPDSAPPAAGRFKVAALPSPRCARFRSAARRTLPDSFKPTGSPQGGNPA